MDRLIGQWMTPFQKQCVVVVGASINMAQLALVMGFAATLLPQLRAKDSSIPIDTSSASWIVALPAFSVLIGNLTVPSLMAKLGRRKANLISIAIVTSGWVGVTIAWVLTWLLVARFLQGLSVGMSSCLTPILIGEYASPKNRGAFMIFLSISLGSGTFVVHILGSYLTWKWTAIIITIVSLVNFLIVSLSPETPSWLADQKRYEECEKVFKYLREEGEVNELHKLIQASMANRQSSSSNIFKGYKSILKKKEFYKPIIIMIHLYPVGQWGGINILCAFIMDVVHHTVGSDFDYVVLMALSADVQRVLSCVFAVFLIKRMRRRTILFSVCGANALVFLITAGYLYAKSNNLLPFDHHVVGILLVHALMLTVAIGSQPMPYAIAGEIFALRYKSFSSGFSCLFCSLHIFLSTKTFPFLLNSIGLHGAYCLYAFILMYCLIVLWFILPETKDRSLQEIEDEFKGVVNDDLKATEPLTSQKGVMV